MKELSIEERAQRYDEAIERAKKWYNAPNVDKIPTFGNRVIEEIFPELKESEESKDERIRKFLHHTFTVQYLAKDGLGKWHGEPVSNILAWLEKQVKQKLTLPKWKYKKDHTPLLRDSLILNKYGCVAKSPSGALVSDVWVIDYDELVKLPKEELEKQGEQNLIMAKSPQLGEQKPTDKVEPKFKVGDVVCDKSCTTLDKGAQPNLEIVDIRNGLYICDKGYIPISYQDEYVLVAKKIENEIEIPFGAKDSELQEATYFIPQGFHAEIDDDKVVIKKGEKNAAWSEEDELKRSTLIHVVKKLQGSAIFEGLLPEELIDWLKSLKQRIGG